MQKLLLVSLTMLISWAHSWPLYAQTIASTQSLHRSSATQGSQQGYESLQRVLSRIQSKHEVFLNYRTNLVENRRVATQSLDLEGEDLEQQLRRVLQPLELDFAKVKDNYYVIYQKGEAPPIVPVKRSKLSAADEPILPRPQTLSAAPNGIQLTLPQALEKKITERVADLTDDLGLPGVNILAKGTTIGTVTDIDGNYRITVPDETETLVFSSVGYSAEEIAINGQTVINVAMSPDIQSLQEVVVVAYGEKSKKLMTESIGTVDAEAIQKLRLKSFSGKVSSKFTALLTNG